MLLLIGTPCLKNFRTVRPNKKDPCTKAFLFAWPGQQWLHHITPLVKSEQISISEMLRTACRNIWTYIKKSVCNSWRAGSPRGFTRCWSYRCARGTFSPPPRRFWVELYAGHFTGSTALKNIAFIILSSLSCGSSFWGWSWWRWGTARGGACEAWYVWWCSFYSVFCLMHYGWVLVEHARCSFDSLAQQSFLLARPRVACSPSELAPLFHRKLPLLWNAPTPQAEHLLMWSALARLDAQPCGWFGQVLPWLGLAFNLQSLRHPIV